VRPRVKARGFQIGPDLAEEFDGVGRQVRRTMQHPVELEHAEADGFGGWNASSRAPKPIALGDERGDAVGRVLLP